MFNVVRFPIRSDSIRLGKTPHQHAHTQKKDLSNGGALVISYLEVERAVHAVLLRPEDARQVFRHDDDDERRIYTEGKNLVNKKSGEFFLLGEKIRVKRDTHRILSKGLARTSEKQRGVGSFESIEKRQTRTFFERFERNLDRVEEDKSVLKKSTSSFGSKCRINL